MILNSMSFFYLTNILSVLFKLIALHKSLFLHADFQLELFSYDKREDLHHLFKIMFATSIFNSAENHQPMNCA